MANQNNAKRNNGSASGGRKRAGTSAAAKTSSLKTRSTGRTSGDTAGGFLRHYADYDAQQLWLMRRGGRVAQQFFLWNLWLCAICDASGFFPYGDSAAGQ